VGLFDYCAEGLIFFWRGGRAFWFGNGNGNDTPHVRFSMIYARLEINIYKLNRQ
jgi:hypothetical protein